MSLAADRSDSTTASPADESAYRVGLVDQRDVEWAIGIEPLTAHDFRLEFEQPAPCFSVGSKAKLRVESEDSPSSEHAIVSILERSETDEACTYRCRLGEGFSPGGLSPEVLAFFNRRRKPRVQVDPKRPVMVQIELPEKDRTDFAKLQDISESGMRVAVEPALEQESASIRSVVVSFVPPGEEKVTMTANIRLRFPRSRRIIWGLEFDSEETEDYGANLDAVKSFVRRRLNALSLR